MRKAEHQKENLPVAINFQDDAGKGMEGADRDSYAIPFLIVLQPLSPGVVDGSIVGAKAGTFLNSVTKDLYEQPVLVPCAFQRRWIRWGAREAGGGFKGEFTTAQVNELRERGVVKDLDGRLYYPEQDGSVNPNRSDRLTDTRSHYCLVLRAPDDELPVAMVMALSSTGVKVSKNLLSRIDSVKMKGSDGKIFTPPSFANMFRAHTVMKSNDQGKWWLPEIDMLGPVRSLAVYAAARAFHAQVSAGKVEVAHDSVAEGGDSNDERM